MATYQWKIPSLSFKQKIFVCTIFAQNSYNKYIATEIIELFAKYFIIEEYTLFDIKNAPPLSKFRSPFVSIQNLRWYFKLYPNSCSDQTVEQIRIFIRLASIPPNISKIKIKYIIKIKQLKNECNNTAIFDEKHKFCKSPRNIWHLSQINNLNELSIEVTINILQLWDKYNKDIAINDYIYDFHLKQLYKPFISYEWNISNKKQLKLIKNAKNGELIESPMFLIDGFMWRLQLYPNGFGLKRRRSVSLFLGLVSFPDNLCQIVIGYKIKLKETNDNWSTMHAFTKLNCIKSYGCYSFIKTEKIKNLNKISIIIEMIVIDVYDINEKLICDYYHNSDTTKEHSNTIIETQNEYDMDETFDNIINTIDSLLQIVNSDLILLTIDS